MKIFETHRLIVKRVANKDREHFAELLTHPEILSLIPQKPFQEDRIADLFNKSLNLEWNDLRDQKCACGIFEKENPEMIGLALFLINENQEYALGYRFRLDYWGKGYGTEITQGMLEFYFKVLVVEKVTADVNIENLASVSILEKFMTPVEEFFNERDQCIDRRYDIDRKNWPNL